jgi:hypothetical protein
LTAPVFNKHVHLYNDCPDGDSNHYIGSADGFSTESIVDEVWTDVPLDQKIFKNVYHTKEAYKPFLASNDIVRLSLTQYQQCVPTATCSFVWQNIDHNYPVGYSLLQSYPLDIDTTFGINELYRGLSAVVPTLSNQLGDMNVIELLSDITSVPKLVPSLLSGFKTLASRSSLKTTVKDYGSSHLGVQFGLLPTLSDAEYLFTIADRLDAFITRWNRMAAKREVLNFHASLDTRDDLEFFTDDDGYADTQCVIVSSTVHYMKSGTRTGLVHLYVRPLPIRISKFSLLWRLLGLDRPVSSTYQALPFSWLIDYFYNIGDALKNWEGDLENLLQFEVVSAGMSSTYTIRGTGERRARFINGQEIGFGISEYTFRSYQRLRINRSAIVEILANAPDTPFTLPSARQSVNTLAFAVQKM